MTDSGKSQRYKKLARRFDRIASGFEAHDFLHAEVRERLLERLPLFRLDPERILDLGCGTGGSKTLLEKHFPEVPVFYLDVSGQMCKQAGEQAIQANALQLPFPDNSLDLVLSNFMLHYVSDLPAAFREVNRVLCHGGLFLFNIAGAQSLQELREAWSFDNYPHIDALPDLQTVGDVVQSTGLTDPVLDSEIITVTYTSFSKMIRELRAVSTARDTGNRRQGLTGKTLWSTMRAACEAGRDTEGKLPVSIEVIYGHAFGGNIKTAAEPAEVEIPLSQLLGRGPRKMDND